ncbi:Spermatid-associated protein [Fukomys damarensis]|uniref:Spermatid-associated protein n=1 Tax=Fukomys damarensis TaxID=885580 RepID=A0A091D6X0_FUKDA|nr:Spermatid-associated protein [Fukomys damarensis]
MRLTGVSWPFGPLGASVAPLKLLAVLSSEGHRRALPEAPQPVQHTPRCSREAAVPGLSRRVVSQHSYPLNSFSSAPFDPMERPTSQADLELDYNPPRVQLSSANTNRRVPGRAEYLLQEESRCLREENRALRVENRALRRENKILQVFWEEHKATVGCQDSQPPSPLLRKESASQEAVQKEPAAPPAQRSKESSSLQLLREENRTLLQQLLAQSQAYWARVEDKAAAVESCTPGPSPHEEPHSPGLLPDQGPGLSSSSEEPKGPATPQEDAQTLRALRELICSLSGPSREEEGKASPGPLQLLRERGQALRTLREENRLLQENRALHALLEKHGALQEENKALWENKLKLQQLLVIDTVIEVTALMAMIIEELYAFMPAKNKDPKKPSRVRELPSQGGHRVQAQNIHRAKGPLRLLAPLAMAHQLAGDSGHTAS